MPNPYQKPPSTPTPSLSYQKQQGPYGGNPVRFQPPRNVERFKGGNWNQPERYQNPYKAPTDFWRYGHPDNWGDVYKPNFGPEKWNRQGPSYQPSYWEEPLNVARHYWQMKNMPPGENLPDWIDPKALDMAYRYMEQVQGTEDWTNWKYINQQDPARQWLQTLQSPPLDYLLTPSKFQEFTMAQLQATTPDQWTPEQLGALTDDQRRYFTKAQEMWANKVPFEELPTWQKMTYNIQQNPILSGAATMVPFAIAGATGGAAGGAALGGFGAIPGAILGGGIPLALGAGLGAASTYFPSAAEMLNKLDIFAEGFERAAGLGLQVEGAFLDPETFGSLQEVLDNLPEAWKAGSLTYNVGALGSKRDEGVINIGMGNAPIGARLDVANIFPAVEYAWRYVTDNHPEIVQFSKGKEVFPQLQVVTDEQGQQYAVGPTGPTEMDVMGLAALVQARRDMLAGQPPEQVIERYMYEYGFSGEFADLAGHIALDPLNVLPKMTARGVATVSRVANLGTELEKGVGLADAWKATGNQPLARAFANSHGVVQGWRQYTNFIRNGLTGAADDLTGAQVFIGGLNAEGIRKSLDPEFVPTNPVSRAFNWMFGQTPDAQARAYTNLLSNNGANLMDFRRGDFPSQVELIRRLQNTSPTELASIAAFMGSPDMTTAAQGLKNFTGLDDQLRIWEGTTFQRTTLNKISEIMGESVPTIIKELQDAKGADNLYQRLVRRINETNPELARSLAEDAAGGMFTPQNLQQVADAYTGANPVPWHPDEAAARLLNAVVEHGAKWAVDVYGVKPSKGVSRFFDTLKRAQSVVLLGFNPAYALNNGFNNVATRAVDGIFGYRRTASIINDLERFGYKPYRFQAGTGAAQVIPDITAGHIGSQHVYQSDIAAEKVIRNAMYTPDGKIRQGIDAANNLGFSNKMSAALERLESMQAIDIGLRQFMDNHWTRGKGFENLTPDLRNALERFGGAGMSETVIRAIEDGRGREEILGKIFGAEAGKYDPATVARDVFKEFGMDSGQARNMLGPLYDEISQNLGKPNTTPDDVISTFQRVRDQAESYVNEMFARDLQTRIDQVATQAGGGGYAEALRIYQDHELHMAEIHQQHFEHLDETWAKEQAIRSQAASVGATPNQAAIDAIWAESRTYRNRVWAQARKSERASMMGLLEGLGVEDISARRYEVGLTDMSRRWDDFYATVERERLEFNRGKYDTPEAREIAYQEMQARYLEYYDQAILDVKAMQGALDEIFVQGNIDSFGPEAGLSSAVYRQKMAELADMRYNLQRSHRENTSGASREVRRRASQDFYNNQYLPFIQEMFRQEIEASGVYGKTITNDMPSVEFTRPVAGATPPGGAASPPTPAEPIITPPPSDFRNANEVFKIAQEYGVSSAERLENGTMVYRSGAKNHILNIVRQIDPNITAFEQITPEMARTAFEMRAQGIRGGSSEINIGDNVSVLARGNLEGRVVSQMKDAKNGARRWKIEWPDGTTSIHQGTSVSRIVPPPEGGVVQYAAGFDAAEYRSYLDDAGANDANIARIIDDAERMSRMEGDITPDRYLLTAGERNVDTEKALARIENPERAPLPYGPYAPGVIENTMQPQYSALQQAQFWAEKVRPMLDAMEQKLLASNGERITLGGKELPGDLAASLNKYLDGVFKDLSTHKIAATSWAESLRDWSLLNYSDRRGFDNLVSWAYPYQFWYTRSAYQWLTRAIDRPAWFANYARMRNFMNRNMQVPGFPSRLANRIAIPAPYLPEWAGGNIWIDPIRKALPLEEFTGPIDYWAKSKSEQERAAETIIVQMHGRGEIGSQEAAEAFSSRSGSTWQKAMQQAEIQINGEKAGAESWFDLIMQPAMYLTLPYQLLTGQAPESPMPITRTGNALKAVTEGTPLHMVGQLLGSVMAGPENLMRRAAGVSEFGDWGEYYIDRQLSNMVAEGLLDSDDAIQQMIERQGPAYEEAVRRVQLEQAFSVPGSLPIYAATHGANVGEFMSALMFGLMPAGLLPDGELAQRGLAEKYKHAREMYNLGDERALSEFFDQNPQLESRMALWDEPEERLRQFMISQVWDRYSDMSGVDKQSVRDQFGNLFTDGFLNDETRNYDMLDIETLAFWANSMGGDVPMTEQTAGVLSEPDFLMSKIEMAPPNEAAAMDAYRNTRNQLFPNWYALQNMYFALDKPDRRTYLSQFPELIEYWDWNRSYKEANPVVEKYTQAPDTSDVPVMYDLSFMREFTPGLTRQLYSHYYSGTPLSGGTMMELNRLWNINKRPGGDFQTFLDDVLRGAVAP